MKRYIIGLCIAVSSLVHAADEPKKKTDCAKLARFIDREIPHSRPQVWPGHLSVIVNKLFSTEDFDCNKPSLSSKQLFALYGAKQTAEMAEGHLAALEYCVGQSPEYAAAPDVIIARKLLKGLSVARWYQCSGAHDAAVQEYESRLAQERRAKAKLEEEEKEMRAYVQQVAGNRR